MTRFIVPPEECGSLKEMISFLSGKWNLPICIVLFNGSKRFNELKEELSQRAGEEICSSSLSHALKNLEDQGFITRNVVVDSTPVKVEYSLTEKGKALENVVKAILEWTQKYNQSEKDILA